MDTQTTERMDESNLRGKGKWVRVRDESLCLYQRGAFTHISGPFIAGEAGPEWQGLLTLARQAEEVRLTRKAAAMVLMRLHGEPWTHVSKVVGMNRYEAERLHGEAEGRLTGRNPGWEREILTCFRNRKTLAPSNARLVRYGDGGLA